MTCTGEKSWRCIDGSCTKSHYSCSSYSTKCTGFPKQYYCGLHNGDNCVFSDVYCMRECGTELKSAFTFDSPCAGFSGKCAWMPSTCPKPCGYGKVKCPGSNRCEKTVAFCEPCWEFRCANTGKCISSFRHCNGVDDCGDFSDEMNCGLSGGDGMPTSSTSDTADLTGITVGISIGLIVFIVILVCVIIIIRKRRRNQSRGTVVSRREPGGRPTGGPTIVGATPIANTPRIAGATNPYGSNSRLVPPTQTPYAMVPTAPGSSHSLNSASGHPGAAPPPSYDEVLDNEMQFKRVDPELPSYEDAEHIPPINPNYTSTSSV